MRVGGHAVARGLVAEDVDLQLRRVEVQVGDDGRRRSGPAARISLSMQLLAAA